MQISGAGTSDQMVQTSGGGTSNQLVQTEEVGASDHLLDAEKAGWRDAKPVLVSGLVEPFEAEHQQERGQVKRELNQAEQELESLKRLRAEVKDEPGSGDD